LLIRRVVSINSVVNTVSNYLQVRLFGGCLRAQR
jgi:hypothetical protein